MPFNEPHDFGENPLADTPYFEESGSGAFTVVNEDLVYDDPDWQNPDAVTHAQGINPALTIIDRSGGYATVRLNRNATFSGSIWFQGNVSGTIPAGATLRGRDANNNGIPDLLERMVREGKIVF